MGKKVTHTSKCWAILWGSNNKLDGKRQFFIGEVNGTTGTKLFPTRQKARKFLRIYGYLRNRPDLRAEPHGWLMPKAVRVEIVIREIANV